MHFVASVSFADRSLSKCSCIIRQKSQRIVSKGTLCPLPSESFTCKSEIDTIPGAGYHAVLVDSPDDPVTTGPTPDALWNSGKYC